MFAWNPMNILSQGIPKAKLLSLNLRPIQLNVFQISKPSPNINILVKVVLTIIEKELKNETVSASDDVPNEVEEEVLSEKPIPLWATFDPNEVIFQISYLQ